MGNNDDRIDEAFSRINYDFGNFEQLLKASREFEGVSGEEVIEWISGRMPCWDYLEVFNGSGVLNIEKVFGAKFSIDTLINNYFTDEEHWYFSSCRWREWLDEFNMLSGRRITANDVIEHLNVNFLIDSRYGPGLDIFVRFVEKNGGDPKILVRRIAPEIENFSLTTVEDVIYFLSPYLNGELDMVKLFHQVDWDNVSKNGGFEAFMAFFEPYVPTLVEELREKGV